MASELLVRGNAQQLYVEALTQAWRSSVQLYDPSVWLQREPDIDEKMLRDADIAHAISYRQHLIAGRNWTVIPRKEEGTRGKVATMIAQEMLDSIVNFTQSRYNLSRAFVTGARFAEITWEEQDLGLGDGVMRKWRVPIALTDMDKRRFRLNREHASRHQGLGAPVYATWDVWDLSVQDWRPLYDATNFVRHVYANDEGTLGYGRGLRDALGWWWYAKEHVFQETLDAVERFGQGLLVAKVEGLRDGTSGVPNKDRVKKWLDLLEMMKARHVAVFDGQDEISMNDMGGTGWQLMTDIRKEIRETVTALILGGTLNVGGDTDSGGSYARAITHENSTEALIQFDRELLEESLSDDLLGACWHANWRNIVELGLRNTCIPLVSITQEKREEPKERVEVAGMMADMGVEVSKAQVYEQSGYSAPEPGEPVVEPPPEPASPFPMPGQGSLPFRRRKRGRERVRG